MEVGNSWTDMLEPHEAFGIREDSKVSFLKRSFEIITKIFLRL